MAGQFLAQPLTARLAFAQQARAASQAHQSGLKEQGLMEAITDVAPATVDATIARFGIDRLIHGHTHRPECMRTAERQADRARGLVRAGIRVAGGRGRRGAHLSERLVVTLTREKSSSRL